MYCIAYSIVISKLINQQAKKMRLGSRIDEWILRSDFLGGSLHLKSWTYIKQKSN